MYIRKVDVWKQHRLTNRSALILGLLPFINSSQGFPRYPALDPQHYFRPSAKIAKKNARVFCKLPPSAPDRKGHVDKPIAHIMSEPRKVKPHKQRFKPHKHQAQTKRCTNYASNRPNTQPKDKRNNPKSNQKPMVGAPAPRPHSSPSTRPTPSTSQTRPPPRHPRPRARCRRPRCSSAAPRPARP